MQYQDYNFSFGFSQLAKIVDCVGLKEVNDNNSFKILTSQLSCKNSITVKYGFPIEMLRDSIIFESLLENHKTEVLKYVQKNIKNISHPECKKMYSHILKYKHLKSVTNTKAK